MTGPAPAPVTPPVPTAPATPHRVARELYVELPAEDISRAISKMDWNRLKRMVEECPVHTRLTQIVYSVFFGIAASAGFSIVPLNMATGTPPWVMPFYWLTTIFSLVIAVVFVILDRRFGDITAGHLGLVKKDMQEIEGTFS